MASIRLLCVTTLLLLLGSLSAIEPPATMAIVGGTVALPVRDPVPVADPFPIRRVLLKPQDYAAKLATPEGQAWVTLTHADFEARVRAATQAQTDTLPHLSTAAYSARLVDGSLVGEGTWGIAYPTSRAGAIALDPLRIAVNQAEWLGLTKTPALLVRPGNSPSLLWADPALSDQVHFQWSARAGEEPGEYRFDLRLPVTPTATMNLELPVGATPGISRADALLTGPFPGQTEALKKWKLAFGGQNRLVLSIRQANRNNTLVPMVKASVDITATLTPGLATMEYDWTLDAHRGTFDEWVFETDPRLRVSAVTSASLNNWTFTPGADETLPGMLRVRLTEPETEGRVAITAVLPLVATEKKWTVPALRMVNGILNDESLIIRVKPELALDKIDLGEYRILDRAVLLDRTTVVKMEGTFAKQVNQTVRVPVVLHLHQEGSTFRTQEVTALFAQPSKVTLESKITLKVLRGPLATLRVQLPQGYRMTSTQAHDTDAGAAWQYNKNTLNIWTLEPSRPLSTGATSTFTLKAVSSYPVNTETMVVAPLTVLDTAERAGRLVVNDSLSNTSTSEQWVGIPPTKSIAFATVAEPPRTLNPTSGVASPTVLKTVASATFTYDGIRFHFTTNKATHWQMPATARDVHLRINGHWVDDVQRVNDDVIFPNLPVSDVELDYLYPLDIGLFHKVELTKEPAILWQWKVDESPWLLWDVDSTHVVLVNKRAVVGGAWALTGLLLVVGFMRGMKWPMVGVTVCLVVACVFLPRVFATELYPAAVVAGFIVGIRFIRIRQGLLAVMFIVLCPIYAADADTVTVYLHTNDTGVVMVACPPSVLAKLETLTKRNQPTLAITRAEYEGRALGDSAELNARYFVTVTQPGPHTLNLPLGKAKLAKLLVDGQPAFPEVVTGGVRVGFTKVRQFEVQATVIVPVSATGVDRELRFTGPEVPQSKIRFSTSSGSRSLSAPLRKGSETLQLDRGGQTLYADLGAGAEVVLQWRAGPPGPRPGLVVQEFGVWDFSLAGANLTWACVVNADQGSIVRLNLEVPAELEPGRVLVRTVDTQGAIATAVGIRDWALGSPVASYRTLSLTFATPFEGKFVVVVPMVSPYILTTNPTLKMPRIPRTTDVQSVYALRTEGLNMTDWIRTGAMNIPPDVAMKPFLNIPEFKLDRFPVTRAVKRTGTAAVLLQPTLVDGKP